MRTQWRTKKEPIALHHVAGSSHVHKDWVTLIQTSSWSLHHEFSTWSSENLCFFFFVRQSALCWDTPTYAHIGARSMQTYMYIVYIIRYIYIYVIDIIFGPLKRFTNSSRWSFYIYIYIYIIYLYIYIPMSSDMSSNLEMHLFQLPQLLRSWSKSGDLLLRRGGNSLPERLDLWDTNFMTALKGSKQEQPQVWVIFLGD